MPKVLSNRRGRPAAAGGANRFAALLGADSDDDDKPAFSLAPPILRVGAGDSKRTDGATGDAAPAAAAVYGGGAIPGAGFLPTVAAPGRATPALSGAAELDLAAVTAELVATAAGREATVTEAAWDFSGLSTTAADAAQRVARDVADVEARQLVAEARLAALESDKRLLREKLDRGDLTHRQRARRGDGIVRGEDFHSKLGVKSAKRNAAARRRNAAKHSY